MGGSQAERASKRTGIRCEDLLQRLESNGH
jgi:hypothetical protein